jgi:hypothetical protein
MLTVRIKNKITNSYPIVFHANGDDCDLFDRQEVMRTFYYLLRLKKEKYSSENLTIITCNSGFRKGLLEKSLDLLGLSYTVIGKGARWRFNTDKLKLLRNALDNVRTDFVLFSDDYDVIFTGLPKKILEHFLSLEGCDMLFMAEAFYFPEIGTGEFEQSVSKGSLWQYLNSGVCIARKDFFKRILEEAIEIKNTSSCKAIKRYDQAAYKLLYRKYYPRIRIDNACEVFQSVYFSDNPMRFRSCWDFLSLENIDKSAAFKVFLAACLNPNPIFRHAYNKIKILRTRFIKNLPVYIIAFLKNFNEGGERIENSS